MNTTNKTDKTNRRYRNSLRATSKQEPPSMERYKQDYKQDYKQEYIKDNLQESTEPITSPQQTQHIKISVRLPKGIVTSFTIKKNIIALWLLYTSDTDYLDIYSLLDSLDSEDLNKFSEKVSKLINNFVYKCLNEWTKESGKGLSDFITEKMIEDFLDDYPLYVALLLTIKN